MKIFALSFLAATLVSAQTPNPCAKGEYRSVDGRCLHDQSGETHPAGDGCNTITCMDPACHSAIVTAMACLQPDDPAPVPPKSTFDLGSAITPSHESPMITSGATTVVSGILIDPALRELLEKHKRLIAQIKSCHKRKWPVGDPVCHGTALALAGWFVDEHPEYFGK